MQEWKKKVIHYFKEAQKDRNKAQLELDKILLLINTGILMISINFLEKFNFIPLLYLKFIWAMLLSGVISLVIGYIFSIRQANDISRQFINLLDKPQERFKLIIKFKFLINFSNVLVIILTILPILILGYFAIANL